jgi:hypothetical protein
MSIKFGLVAILTNGIKTMKALYNETLGFQLIEDLGNYVEFHNPEE